MIILEALNLSHSYDSYDALAPLDLELHSSQITVLEGPNGCGKTTLLLCLSGLLRPTTGTIHLCGHDLDLHEPEAKRCLAFAPDVPRYYLELTAWEHLRFIAQAHDSAQDFEVRVEALLKEFGLWEARNLYPHHFSRGMSLKLGLLLALIRPFKVLLLDEPTSAIDTASSRLLVQRLVDLRNQDASILLTTHDPDLKQGLADRVYTLQNGRLRVIQ